MSGQLPAIGGATVALAGFVWGFFVDVGQAERLVGQAVCLALLVAITSRVVVRRGRCVEEKRGARSRDTPMSTDEQWYGFFLLVGIVAALALGDGLHRWTQLTVVTPLCLLPALLLDGWSRRYRRRRDARARSTT